MPVPPGAWLDTEGRQGASKRTSGRQRLNLHAAPRPSWKTDLAPVAAERVDAASTIALPEKLEAGNPGNKRVHVIADNARYHHARLVQLRPERADCRIRFVFLPAHAPHPGAIELLWGVMRREMMYNTFHASFALFVEAIFDFFRRRLPQEWTTWRDTVTDNFKIIGSVCKSCAFMSCFL